MMRGTANETQDWKTQDWRTQRVRVMESDETMAPASRVNANN